MIELSNGLLLFAGGLLMTAFIITMAAMVRFKDVLIKLVILEVVTNLLMAAIGLWAYITQQTVLLDVCLSLALIMFLGIVAYYQFLKN